MDYEKIVLVTRKTRLEGLVERFNTRSQARFYIEHNGGNFDLYESEHETYYAAVEQVRHSLRPLLKLQEIERSYLPSFLFTETDLIVTVGMDGLVVNTAKYLDGQPLIALNPDPAHIDGILLPFQTSEAPTAVRLVLKGQARSRLVSLAQARLNDGQSLLAFNDLFVGIHNHTSARYQIQFGERREEHSSSGVIISTGAGATGWLSSLFNMADGLCSAFLAGQGSSQKPVHLHRPDLAWETDRLVFVVREPFASKTSAAGIVSGWITPKQPLILDSRMPEGGLIFSDGVESDYLAFNAGARAEIGLAAKKTKLITN